VQLVERVLQKIIEHCIITTHRKGWLEGKVELTILVDLLALFLPVLDSEVGNSSTNSPQHICIPFSCMMMMGAG